MSIIQGSFGLPIFFQHLYSYLVTGKYVNLEIQNEDVPDPAAQALLQQVMYVHILLLCDPMWFLD